MSSKQWLQVEVDDEIVIHLLLSFISNLDTSKFASMSSKQWLQVEVGNGIVMHLLLSLISNLDFKQLFVPIEPHLGSVYCSQIENIGLYIWSAIRGFIRV